MFGCATRLMSEISFLKLSRSCKNNREVLTICALLDAWPQTDAVAQISTH